MNEYLLIALNREQEYLLGELEQLKKVMLKGDSIGEEKTVDSVLSDITARLDRMVLVFNEIILLNKNEYKEKEVSSIKPEWDKNISSIHTFNNIKQLTLIDAVYRVN